MHMWSFACVPSSQKPLTFCDTPPLLIRPPLSPHTTSMSNPVRSIACRSSSYGNVCERDNTVFKTNNHCNTQPSMGASTNELPNQVDTYQQRLNGSSNNPSPSLSTPKRIIVLKRPQTANNMSRSTENANACQISSSGPSSTENAATGQSNGTTTSTTVAAPIKTFEEREQEYNEVRKRIFGPSPVNNKNIDSEANATSNSSPATIPPPPTTTDYCNDKLSPSSLQSNSMGEETYSTTGVGNNKHLGRSNNSSSSPPGSAPPSQGGPSSADNQQLSSCYQPPPRVISRPRPTRQHSPLLYMQPGVTSSTATNRYYPSTTVNPIGNVLAMQQQFIAQHPQPPQQYAKYGCPPITASSGGYYGLRRPVNMVSQPYQNQCCDINQAGFVPTPNNVPPPSINGYYNSFGKPNLGPPYPPQHQMVKTVGDNNYVSVSSNSPDGLVTMAPSIVAVKPFTCETFPQNSPAPEPLLNTGSINNLEDDSCCDKVPSVACDAQQDDCRPFPVCFGDFHDYNGNIE